MNKEPDMDASVESQRIEYEHESLHPVAHWRLVSKQDSAPEDIMTGEYYRLITEGGQLYPYYGVTEGINLETAAKITRNVKIEAEKERDGKIRLNSRVAISIKQKEIRYVVFEKEAKGAALGFVRYDPESEYDAIRSGRIYQWILKSVPYSKVRDHRERIIKTQDEFALHNVVIDGYLIYDRMKQRLRWQKQ